LLFAGQSPHAPYLRLSRAKQERIPFEYSPHLRGITPLSMHNRITCEEVSSAAGCFEQCYLTSSIPTKAKRPRITDDLVLLLHHPQAFPAISRRVRHLRANDPLEAVCLLNFATVTISQKEGLSSRSEEDSQLRSATPADIRAAVPKVQHERPVCASAQRCICSAVSNHKGSGARRSYCLDEGIYAESTGC